MTRHVWVFVGNCQGIEDITEVYQSERSANRRYDQYAREHDIPFDIDEDDFEWLESEYAAWTSRVEVQP